MTKEKPEIAIEKEIFIRSFKLENLHEAKKTLKKNKKTYVN